MTTRAFVGGSIPGVLMKPFPCSRGAWRSLCVVLSFLLSACDESPAPGGGDAGPPPWDGTSTPLEDLGDVVETGRHDACQFINPESLDPLLCERLTAFDLSSCSPGELSGAEGQGIFQVNLRGEMRVRAGQPTTTSISRNTVSVRLHTDGTPDAMNSGPLVARVTEGGTFFLAGRRSLAIPSGNIITTTALAGCHVPAPGVITGCYVSCSSDARFGKTLGTFVAQRMTWAAGEGESSGGLSLVSEAATPVSRAVDLFVAKEHAYVVSLNASPRLGGLSVFDVRDRRNPVLKKTLSLPDDTDWNGVWAKDDALYIASNSSGLVILDIREPANPIFVRRAEGPYSVHTVLVDGDRLYANAPGTGTYVYDVSKPLEPTLLQIVTPTPGGFSGGPHDVFAYQGRLYISNAESGYSIMDITDLNDVRHLGDYLRPDLAGYAHHSAVGTFAGRTIAFEGGEFNGSHVRVLDVTDPASISLIATHRMRPTVSMHNLLLRGHLLYVAWYHEGLRVLDVSNPTQPRQVAHLNTFREADPGRGHGLFEGTFGVRIPGDGYVYLVDSTRGLIITHEL